MLKSKDIQEHSESGIHIFVPVYLRSILSFEVDVIGPYQLDSIYVNFL